MKTHVVALVTRDMLELSFGYISFQDGIKSTFFNQNI